SGFCVAAWTSRCGWRAVPRGRFFLCRGGLLRPGVARTLGALFGGRRTVAGHGGAVATCTLRLRCRIPAVRILSVISQIKPRSLEGESAADGHDTFSDFPAFRTGHPWGCVADLAIEALKFMSRWTAVLVSRHSVET